MSKLPDSLDAPQLNEDQEKALKKLYYKDKNYFGRDKIFKLAREKYPELKISRR